MLRERAARSTPTELRSEVQGLIDDMIETMRAAGGAGLAANQVGEPAPHRSSSRSTDNPRYPYKPPIPLTVIVNPVIEPVGDETVPINEGCLSVPGPARRRSSASSRSASATSTATATTHEELRRGPDAPGTFQHEVDHLDGVLFLDRVTDPTTFTTWEQFDRHHRDAFGVRSSDRGALAS